MPGLHAQRRRTRCRMHAAVLAAVPYVAYSCVLDPGEVCFFCSTAWKCSSAIECPVLAGMQCPVCRGPLVLLNGARLMHILTFMHSTSPCVFAACDATQLSKKYITVCAMFDALWGLCGAADCAHTVWDCTQALGVLHATLGSAEKEGRKGA